MRPRTLPSLTLLVMTLGMFGTVLASLASADGLNTADSFAVLVSAW